MPIFQLAEIRQESIFVRNTLNKNCAVVIIVSFSCISNKTQTRAVDQLSRSPRQDARFIVQTTTRLTGFQRIMRHHKTISVRETFNKYILMTFKATISPQIPNKTQTRTRDNFSSFPGNDASLVAFTRSCMAVF